MRVAAFYHIWAEGDWTAPLNDYLKALYASEFDGGLHIGIVGRPSKRIAVLSGLELQWPQFSVVFEAQEGFESGTIMAVREYAREHGGAVMYAHTKGSSVTDPFRDRWRTSMTNRVILDWKLNVELLKSCDAVGCHWLTEERYPGMFGAMTEPAPGSGFFGGNFWMARCDYLRRLPECPMEPRWQAESWIGWRHPTVTDLLPGWPHDNRWPELCE